MRWTKLISVHPSAAKSVAEELNVRKWLLRFQRMKKTVRYSSAFK